MLPIHLALMQTLEVKYGCPILTNEDTEAGKLDLFKTMQRINERS